MGTAWYLASSNLVTNYFAMRTIIGASLAIVGVLLVYGAARKYYQLKLVSFLVIVGIISLATTVLLSETVQHIVNTEGLWL